MRLKAPVEPLVSEVTTAVAEPEVQQLPQAVQDRIEQADLAIWDAPADGQPADEKASDDVPAADDVPAVESHDPPGPIPDGEIVSTPGPIPPLVATADGETVPLPDDPGPAVVAAEVTWTAVKQTPEQAFEAKMQRLAVDLAQASIQEVQAKGEHKAAKEYRDELVEQFNDLILRGPERLPLFDSGKATPSKPTLAEQERAAAPSNIDQPPAAEACTDEPPAASPEAIDPPADDDDSWREVPVEDLTELSTGIVGILQSAEVDTVGKLADWCSKRPLTEIPKVGAAKAEKIEAALEAFWKARAGK